MVGPGIMAAARMGWVMAECRDHPADRGTLTPLASNPIWEALLAVTEPVLFRLTPVHWYIGVHDHSAFRDKFADLRVGKRIAALLARLRA